MMINNKNNPVISVFFLLVILAFIMPVSAMASVAADTNDWINLTKHPIGLFALILSVLAYVMVMCEECTQLRKSKPVILAAGVIWGLIAYQYSSQGINDVVIKAFRHNLLEFAALFLFLLVAMTYINAMEERQVFDALRSWLIRKGYGFRQLFWKIGRASCRIGG